MKKTISFLTTPFGFSKKNIIYALILCLMTFSSISGLQSQTIKTVGNSGADYTTLKLAFDAINAGALTGAIELKIINNTTETASAVLFGSGTGSSNYTSVKIYPAVDGKKISGNIASLPLIGLDGADNVTIDGRVNQTGSTISLSIENTSSGSSQTSNIRFINDASSNLVKYCNIKGSTLGQALIIFGESNRVGGTGNDNNTIQYNTITNSGGNRPIRAFLSIGTSGKENSSNTLSNNQIVDIINLNTGNNPGAMYIGLGSLSFTVSQNSIYETAPLTPSSSPDYVAIQILGGGYGHLISQNYIGGSGPQCSGAPMRKTNANDNQFIGISLAGSTVNASDIQGNKIANILWNNATQASFYGISSDGARVNIGNPTGNQIGSPDSTGSIVLTNSTGDGLFVGISIAGNGQKTISNNIISGIKTANTLPLATNFYGIQTSGSANLTIQANTIGSTTIPNSIHLSSTAEASSSAQKCYGIYTTSTGNNSILDNTISGITNQTTNGNTSAAGQNRGILVNAGTNIITGNTVRNLSIANAYNYQNSYAGSIGIIFDNYLATTAQTISSNTVYNLSNSHPSYTGHLIGIYYSGGSTISNISNNFVHSLTASSNNAVITGMQTSNGSSLVVNNIVSLSLNLPAEIRGLLTMGNDNMYFNTVFISGSPSTGSLNSFAFFAYNSTSNYRNNLFINSRSNTGSATGKHYAIRLSGNSNLTINYNDYYTTGAGGVLGSFNSTNKMALSDWKSATGQDSFSNSVDPGFANPGGTTASSYLPSMPHLVATTGTAVLLDYNATTRSVTWPAMGALEYSVSPCINPTNNGTISGSQTICSGDVPSQLTSLTAATGYSGALEYQWQRSTDGSAFTDMTSATLTTFQPPALTQVTWYRRLAKVTCKEWNSAGASNTVQITIRPPFTAGSIGTTGESTCPAGDPLPIPNQVSASGGDGNISYQWQSSSTGSGSGYGTISGATTSGYDPPAGLTTSTWYRRLAKDGTCQLSWLPSAGTWEVTVNPSSGFQLSGIARYDNNPQTPLDGLLITLRKNGSFINAVTTNVSGFYSFTGLETGTYSLDISSAAPNGQWQTWNGVNMTDALIVQNHVGNTVPLPVDPPVIQIAADVKNTIGTIDNADVGAIRKAAKYGWGYFNIPKWVFSGVNSSLGLSGISISCGDVTRDIKGLCAGDVNGTYVPTSGFKTVEPGLELVNRGALPVTDEIVFPLRIVETHGCASMGHETHGSASLPTTIGAITLLMNYDPTLIEITGVEIPGYGGEQPSFETRDGVLYIGWVSTESIRVEHEGTLLLIHARLTEEFRISHFTFGDSHLDPDDLNVKREMRNVKCKINFTLNENPLSELADSEGNVIGGLKLSIPDAGENGEMAKWRNSEILVYPNPAQSILNIEIENQSSEPGTMSLELRNLQGVVVMKTEPETMVAGWHKHAVEVSRFMPGVYFLRTNVNGEILMRKVIITR